MLSKLSVLLLVMGGGKTTVMLLLGMRELIGMVQLPPAIPAGAVNSALSMVKRRSREMSGPGVKLGARAELGAEVNVVDVMGLEIELVWPSTRLMKKLVRQSRKRRHQCRLKTRISDIA